jgi:hypothetical protein
MTTLGETDRAASAGAPPTEPPLRASDVDRLATVRVLQDAVALGLLTPDEGSERMAAAFAAVHLAELTPLTADLPASRARTAPGWRPLATMAVDQVRASLHSPADGRVTPARVAVAVAITVLLVLALGSLIAGLFDGGGGDFGGHEHMDWD